MPAGQLAPPSLTEQAFVQQALCTAALRTDGRRPREARPLLVKFGEQLGWCQVSLGNSMYVRS